MAIAKGLLSSLCKLEYCADPSATTPTWTEVESIQEIPDLGSAPEMVDVTCLGDTNKRSIPGLVDYGSLEFTCLYDSAQYNTLNGLSKQTWRITFNDAVGTGSSAHGSQFQWEGTPKVYISGFGVDAAIQYKLVIGVESALTFTAAA